jgi:glycosyltransferase involved in cell wall biosynthesis
MQYPDNLRDCKTAEYFVPYLDLNFADNNILNYIKIIGRFLYSYDAKKRLSKLLDEYPVDIAHLHNIYHHISPSIIHVLKKRRIPIIMTLHDYKLVCGSYSMMIHGIPCEACSGGKYFMSVKRKCVKDSYLKSLLTYLEMSLHHTILHIYDNVDIFISPSLFLKNKIEEMGFAKEIIHLPNFVHIEELRKYRIEFDSKNKKKECSFVYFGRLSEEKGLLTLLEAAKILLSKRNARHVDIKIIGEGPMRDVLEEKAELEGISNVKFHGFKTGKHLFEEVLKSMAVVLPSEWYENNPLTVLEAFAMEIPVIGARIGGIPELVQDNKTGLTFKSGDPEDLSKKIEYSINNPDKITEWGKNARAYLELELTVEKHYNSLMEIYKKALTHHV